MTEIRIAESKSMANRLLVLSSFSEADPSGSELDFSSQADDILRLKEAIKGLRNGAREFDAGDGGTTLRFLVARLSRERGEYRVNGSERLLARPLSEFAEVLGELGVEVMHHRDHVLIKSQGWVDPGRVLSIDCKRSTQFASAIILSTLNLPFDLNVQLINLESSLPYLEMTLAVMREAGIAIASCDDHLSVAKEQKIHRLPRCEIDLSSAFSVAAIAVASRTIKIPMFPVRSVQADARFCSILRAMGVEISEIPGVQEGLVDVVVSSGTDDLVGVDVDLTDAPDLFPVLAALCSLVTSTSTFRGLENLRHKESDRLEKSIELLTLAGAQLDRKGDDLIVVGPVDLSRRFNFDPDHDHRMAMAAAVLKAAGMDISVLNPSVVKKSFPNFWEIVGLRP